MVPMGHTPRFASPKNGETAGQVQLAPDKPVVSPAALVTVSAKARAVRSALIAVVAVAVHSAASCQGWWQGARLGPAEVVPDAADLAACTDAPLTSFDELAVGTGAGERVAVDGVPRADVVCTALACPGAACCNECGGGYVLRDDDTHRIGLTGLEGCGGMDCSLECKPFGREPTRRYRFVGVHTWKAPGDGSIYADSRIAVERFCRLEDGAQTSPR